MVGRSGAGKTTLLEGLLPLLVAGGRRVATLKHTHHGLLDGEGSDSSRHRLAGASVAALAGPFGVQLWGWEPGLATLLGWLEGSGADLVLVEGYKHADVPRLEVVGAEAPLLAAEAVWGVACDRPEVPGRRFGRRDYRLLTEAILSDDMFTRR